MAEAFAVNLADYGQLNKRCEALRVKVVSLVCRFVFLSTEECCL